MKLFEEGRDRVPGFTHAACEALGCVDQRTARKHVRFVRAACDAKLPALTELLACAPWEVVSFPPGTGPLAILCLLWDAFLKSARDLSGSLIALSLRPLLWLSPGLESWRCFNRSCIPVAQPP